MLELPLTSGYPEARRPRTVKVISSSAAVAVNWRQRVVSQAAPKVGVSMVAAPGPPVAVASTRVLLPWR